MINGLLFPRYYNDEEKDSGEFYILYIGLKEEKEKVDSSSQTHLSLYFCVRRTFKSDDY